jgi:hypothetical protein
MMRLTMREREWLCASLDSMVPGDDHIKVSATRGGSVEVFEDMVETLPPITSLGLRAAVVFVEFLGPAAGLKVFTRFSTLDVGRQEECAAALLNHKVLLVRQMGLLLKMIACLGWGADPRVRKTLGMNEPAKFVERRGEAGK